jgi:hypothetical protein
MAPVDLFLTHSHHFSNEIETRHLDMWIPPGRFDSQISRAGRDIKKTVGLKKPHSFYGKTTPGQITSEAEEMVQKIVTPMDCGKEFTDDTDLLRRGHFFYEGIFLFFTFLHFHHIKYNLS